MWKGTPLRSGDVHYFLKISTESQEGPSSLRLDRRSHDNINARGPPNGLMVCYQDVSSGTYPGAVLTTKYAFFCEKVRLITKVFSTRCHETSTRNSHPGVNSFSTQQEPPSDSNSGTTKSRQAVDRPQDPPARLKRHKYSQNQIWNRTM